MSSTARLAFSWWQAGRPGPAPGRVVFLAGSPSALAAAGAEALVRMDPHPRLRLRLQCQGAKASTQGLLLLGWEMLGPQGWPAEPARAAEVLAALKEELWARACELFAPPRPSASEWHD